jgi:hypothetical protein
LRFAAVAALLPARPAFAGFDLVAFDFAGFADALAFDFRFGAFCGFFVAIFAAFFAAFLVCFAAFFSAFLAFFSARFASFAAFFSAFLASFSAISFALVFFAISISIESLENHTYSMSGQEFAAACIANDITPIRQFGAG